MLRRRFLAAGAALVAASMTALAGRNAAARHASSSATRFSCDRSGARSTAARVGVIANQSGVTSRLESIVDAIRRHGRIRIKAIYGPEHGFRGDRGAGASVTSYVDPQTQLPVYSLYGASRHPSAAMLDGVDVLLFDIQDVGSRAYTLHLDDGIRDAERAAV